MMISMTELKASILRGCATTGQAWALMAINDPHLADTELDAELDNVLLSLAGNLALRQDARFCEVAKRVILENLRRELEDKVTLH